MSLAHRRNDIIQTIKKKLCETLKQENKHPDSVITFLAVVSKGKKYSLAFPEMTRIIKQQFVI